MSTTAQASRFKVLVAANAVSKQDYDNAVASQGQAAADVASGKASVDTAQINLATPTWSRRSPAVSANPR